VVAWERNKVAAGHAPSSIKTRRATLHLVLGDAVAEGLRESNPATWRRGRGRRDRRSRGRGPEKAVTTALGVVLIAEQPCRQGGMTNSWPLLLTASPGSVGASKSVWRWSTFDRRASGSSGSYTSWIPVSCNGVRLGMARIEQSTHRIGLAGLLWMTSRRHGRVHANATRGPTCSVDSRLPMARFANRERRS
jgi:hypothetical protein